MTPTDINQALDRAALASDRARPLPASGCGRAYVRFSGLDRATRAALKAACARRGWRFLTRDSGRNADSIYVGYDNATGIEMAKAVAIAAVLNAHGLPCHWDGEGD